MIFAMLGGCVMVKILMHNDHNPHELLSTIILSSNAETDVVIYVQQAITSH